jgi:hypothetical protein
MCKAAQLPGASEDEAAKAKRTIDGWSKGRPNLQEILKAAQLLGASEDGLLFKTILKIKKSVSLVH